MALALHPSSSVIYRCLLSRLPSSLSSSILSCCSTPFFISSPLGHCTSSHSSSVFLFYSCSYFPPNFSAIFSSIFFSRFPVPCFVPRDHETSISCTLDTNLAGGKEQGEGGTLNTRNYAPTRDVVKVQKMTSAPILNLSSCRRGKDLHCSRYFRTS